MYMLLSVLITSTASTLCCSVISDLLAELRGTVGCLYKLSECVAMLDMLVSLAHSCTVSNYSKLLLLIHVHVRVHVSNG